MKRENIDRYTYIRLIILLVVRLVYINSMLPVLQLQLNWSPFWFYFRRLAIPRLLLLSLSQQQSRQQLTSCVVSKTQPWC